MNQHWWMREVTNARWELIISLATCFFCGMGIAVVELAAAIERDPEGFVRRWPRANKIMHSKIKRDRAQMVLPMAKRPPMRWVLAWRREPIPEVVSVHTGATRPEFGESEITEDGSGPG